MWTLVRFIPTPPDDENKLNLIELLNGQVIDRYEVISGEFSQPLGGEKILSLDSFNKSMMLERFVGGDGSGGG
jgi:hypothetical protein